MSRYHMSSWISLSVRGGFRLGSALDFWPLPPPGSGIYPLYYDAHAGICTDCRSGIYGSHKHKPLTELCTTISSLWTLLLVGVVLVDSSLLGDLLLGREAVERVIGGGCARAVRLGRLLLPLPAELGLG